MMRSRLTGGPKGIREDLILPDCPVDPTRERLGSVQNPGDSPASVGLTLQHFKNHIQASFSVRNMGQRSRLSICRQYGGGRVRGDLACLRGVPPEVGPSEL